MWQSLWDGRILNHALHITMISDCTRASCVWVGLGQRYTDISTVSVEEGGTLVMTPSIEGKAESWAAFLLAPPGVYRGS